MRRMLTIMACLLAAGSALAAADGKALYEKKCAMCHGTDGTPKKMAAGSKAFTGAEFKKDATESTIVSDIHEGKGKMKPVKMTDEEAKAIADYILSLAPKS
jgi:cytochrome c6